MLSQKSAIDNNPKVVEEIACAPALWMWDYLRRSGARGFFLPLSGGADSAATASLVGSMCRMVFQAIQDGNQQALIDIRRIVKDQTFVPSTYQDIVSKMFVTAYLGTANSSDTTRDRAKRVSAGLGALHYDVNIDQIYNAFIDVFSVSHGGKEPKYESQGGTYTEDIAL